MVATERSTRRFPCHRVTRARLLRCFQGKRHAGRRFAFLCTDPPADLPSRARNRARRPAPRSRPPEHQAPRPHDVLPTPRPRRRLNVADEGRPTGGSRAPDSGGAPARNSRPPLDISGIFPGCLSQLLRPTVPTDDIVGADLALVGEGGRPEEGYLACALLGGGRFSQHLVTLSMGSIPEPQRGFRHTSYSGARHRFRA